MIKVIKFIICTFLLVSATNKAVNAGPYTDTFGKCIVKSTTQIDKDELILWMFIAISNHQTIKSVIDLSEGVKTTADKQAAKIVMRLFTVACKTELKEAVKNEGKQAVTDAFALLGKVSMGALMTDQNVQKAMGRYVKFMDLEKLKSLFAE